MHGGCKVLDGLNPDMTEWWGFFRFFWGGCGGEPLVLFTIFGTGCSGTAPNRSGVPSGSPFRLGTPVGVAALARSALAQFPVVC